MRIVFSIALLLGASLQPALAWDQQPNHYRVKVDADKKRAYIDANVWVQGKELAFFNVSPVPGLKNGQADLVQDLQVQDTQGKPVAVLDKGEGEYEVQGDRRLRVRYAVRLEHDTYQWPAGVEEVSYRTDEGVMATGYALFLAPGEKMLGSTEVHFDLPPGWLARTPWRATAQPHVFVAESRRELLNNALFMGTAQAQTWKAGGIEIQLVAGKRYSADFALFKELIDKQLQSYLSMFGQPPQAQRYLVVLNQGDSGDGGAFSGSFSQFLKGDATLANRPIWGRVVAHELLHFWNGLSMAPQDGREEWFKEGVTDYLTLTTLAHNGLVGRAYLMQWLENLSRGQVIARQVQGVKGSVRDAAKDKHKNWLLVYGGGSVAALAMDVEIRKTTANRQGLPEVMRALYAEFGVAGKTYTLTDIVRVAKQATGTDLGPVLARWVESEQTPPLPSLFADVGLQLEQYMLLEHFLLPMPQAAPGAAARFEAMFGQKP